jgi:cyclopropane-fatty-acyl-phospholipid synthase
MARAGARVTAITISNEQLAAARDRIGHAGLEDEVEVRFEDYRLTSGTFDRIVSVEMIEAVGEENWPLFFKTVNERLAPGGVAVIQAITIREDAFAQYRENPDFIQRYIFPGGMLPTVALMRQRAGEQGLGFETVERFGLSYALTLADWRRRFEAAWPQIARLGFDERYRRMWLYYLIYCEVGFERGLIDVGLYRLRKPDVD